VMAGVSPALWEELVFSQPARLPLQRGGLTTFRVTSRLLLRITSVKGRK